MWVDKELDAQIVEATRTTYKSKESTKEVYYSKDTLYVLLEDLLSEIEHLKDELKNEIQDKEDNYIPRPMSDYTGNPEDDRY